MTENSFSSRRDLVLWGAAGQAKVLMECADLLGFEIICLVDNDPLVQPVGFGVPVVIGRDGFDRFLADRQVDSLYGLAAIGGMRGEDRLDIHATFRDRGIRIPVFIHPSAYVARGAQIDEGAQILAGAVIGVDAHVGPATIVNTCASVDHDCDIGAGVHIAPGATLAGSVKVGERSFVGPGAVISSETVLGSDVIVGAGAVVMRDIPDNVVAYGVPARVIRPNAARLR